MSKSGYTFYFIMKSLDLKQMEQVEGGEVCAAMAVAGAVLTIVALSNPITGLIGGLASAYGASFSIAGIGCAFS